MLPFAQGSCAEFTAHVQRRSELGGRHAGQAEPVCPEALFDAQIDLVEHELRGVTHFVRPGDETVVDEDARLAQQPVRDGVVVPARARVDRDTRDMYQPGFVAPDRQARSFDGELAQPQVQQRQRGPGHHEVDARQREHGRRPIGRVHDAERANGKAWIPAVPPRFDGADRDRLSYALTQCSRDVVVMRFDAGEGDEADEQKQRARERDGDQDDIGREPQGADGDGNGRGLAGARGGTLCRHNERPVGPGRF